MCGIAGIVDFSAHPVDGESLTTMRDALTHRGPDDAGLYTTPDCGLASRRLAVLDLSERGHMPMANPEKTVWVVHNGEVYNFRALRTQLESRGHRFQSQTDTEVVLHAYLEWGETCVERFLGMFAFAIWDQRKEQLFAARDRLGVKPFVFRHTEHSLAFASEQHALLQGLSPGAEDVDKSALAGFLAFGFVPPWASMLQGLRKLPPGHTLTFDRGGLAIKRYWQIAFRPTRPITFDEATESVDAALRQAVERRLVSDVPLGCFLSGGIDSGLVTAMAAQCASGPVQAYSVCFHNAGNHDDETDLARHVAQHCGATFHTLELDANGLADLPRLLYHVGEPFADSSALPVYAMARAAKQHITVALTGDGGDEAFCGYLNVRAAWRGERLRQALPASVLALARSACRLGRAIPVLKRMETFLTQYALRPVHEHYDMVNHWNMRLRSDVLKGGVCPEPLEAIRRLVDHAPGLSAAETHQYVDYHLRLPGDYLRKVDVATSLPAMEIRSPFLDHEVVELAASLPMQVKMPGGHQKALLRRLAARYLPPALLNQPKRGFAVPLGHWLRTAWSSWVRDLVCEGLACRSDLVNGECVREIAEAHLNGRENHATRLYSLLCLEIWWRLFIDRTLSPGDTL